MTFSMFLDGYTVTQPFSGYDVEITRPDGSRVHLFPAYTADDYAYSHEATMARAARYVALCEHRRARAS